MRTLCFFLSWCLIATCYALKIIAIEPQILDAAPFLEMPQTITKKSHEPKGDEVFPLPVTSHIQPGVMHAYATKKIAFSQVIFLVGDDALSRTWLKKQAHSLQKSRAIGLVTNLKTSKALDELVALAGLPLHPMNVDELASLLDATCYPFAYEAGTVWQ
jgi:integrating conjugative element protein (TIGR03765 family)